MRARLAILASGVSVELREIVLQQKAPEFLVEYILLHFTLLVLVFHKLLEVVHAVVACLQLDYLSL